MSPNNSSHKIAENDNSFDYFISELRKLVFDEKRCISYTYVSQRFRVHIKTALKILDQFCAEERNENNLSVNYLLSGNNNNDNEIKMERFKIVNESDIEIEKSWYKNGLNQHIYSVSTHPSSDSNESSIELNFDDFHYDINNKEDLQEFQNLTYKKNPNIELRNHVRRCRVIPTVQQNDNCDQIKKQNIKTENQSKPKVKANTKGKNGKKNKISNMFSKNKKEIKTEDEEEEVIQNYLDPFESDNEEEKKSNNDSDNENVVNVDSNDAFGSDQKNDKQNDEVIIETEQKVKSEKKRQTNSSEDEEEEEIIKTKKKSKSKRYKRVRYISESDSNEPEEESAISKFVSTKKENSKPVVKVEEIQETHVDDDGYVVTKTVKKEVVLNNNSNSMKDKKTENNKKELNDFDGNKGKSKPKQSKNAEKTTEKKPKPTKEMKSKTQSSITSFFKPKQVS